MKTVTIKLDPSRVEDFVKYSYLVLRDPKYRDILKVQQWILYYLREFLYEKGFTELLAPMASPCSDPGLRGARKLKTKLYGVEYELTSSVIMYKQASVAGFGKVFFVARNIREEPPENLKTGRHLCEFTQLDVEWAHATIDDVMSLAEDMIIYTLKKVREKCGEILEKYGVELRVPSKPFKRLRYIDAVELLEKHGYMTPEGKEFTQEGEAALSKIVGDFVWITHYPVTSRGFYYLPDSSYPEYNRDFNLLLPEGYGEVIDGGEREYRPEKIRERIKSLGEPLEKYSWFLELIDIGIPPSAGFGLGVERFTRYVMKLKYIWEAVPFPKVPGVAPSP